MGFRKLKNLWSNHGPRIRADCYLIRFWDPHGSVKQIHHEELEERDKERASAFSKIMLKQTDSGIQQLHGAGKRTQDQHRRRRLLVGRPQYEQSQRNSGRRRVHRQ